MPFIYNFTLIFSIIYIFSHLIFPNLFSLLLSCLQSDASDKNKYEYIDIFIIVLINAFISNYISPRYVLFVSIYHAIVADRKPIFLLLLLLHPLLSLSPRSKTRNYFICLGRYGTWATTENGISVALSLSVSVFLLL